MKTWGHFFHRYIRYLLTPVWAWPVIKKRLIYCAEAPPRCLAPTRSLPSLSSLGAMSTESAQSAKQKRYDRQLRLWGEHGQAAMEACNVCLLNGSATGAETLKNLVLPGIGSFTIVDGACVSAVDLGNNFFVEHKHIGNSRAAVVTQLLQELNEHVQGSYVTEDIAQVLDSRPDFLNSFSMVIATQTPLKELRQVGGGGGGHIQLRGSGCTDLSGPGPIMTLIMRP